MNPEKKNIVIAGYPLQPITVGNAAVIAESAGLRQTTAVISVEVRTPEDIRFETQNTNYYLHVVPLHQLRLGVAV